MLLEVRGHLLVPQPPRLPLPQASTCPPQLCKWATKPTKTDQRIIWNKKLLQARSPNWFGGQLRSLAVAKPATPMERFDDKKHLLGKTTSFFYLDRNFFIQVVVVAYYWPRGNRPEQVVAIFWQLALIIFLFSVSPWSNATRGPRGGGYKLKQDLQNTKLDSCILSAFYPAQLLLF